MKKRSVMMALGLVMTLTACGGGNAGTTAAPSSGSETQTEAKAEEKTEGDTAAQEENKEESKTEASGDTVTLKLSNNQPDGNCTTIAVEWFADQVRERTDGRVNIEVYNNGTLGDAISCLEQLQYGGMDIVKADLSTMTNFVDEYNALMMPYIYKNTDEIFATSPSFVEAICNRKRSVSHSKVHYWPQYAEDFYKPMEKTSVEEIPEDDSFKVIFTGNIGTAQGLQILPQTAEILREENVKFVIVGDGRYLDEFEQEIQKRNVQDKFIMIARQPAERIPELLAACDAAFLSFQNDELWTKTIPAKLQSYMACGMPIIASAEGETERIITEAECGVCSAIGDVDKLSENIIIMTKDDLNKMRHNSRKYFERNFEKQELMDQIEQYFNRQ